MNSRIIANAASGCIRDHCMAARSTALDANEMGWQGGGYVSLTLDRRHGIFSGLPPKTGPEAITQF